MSQSIMGGCAGLASVFEDGDDINVEVNIGAPEEAVEEQAEAVDTETEIQEATQEADQQETATELMMSFMDSLEAQQKYLKKYGYTRHFHLLVASQPQLSDVNYGVFEGAESISETAVRGDANTKAALEGIGEALKSAWEWIKKMISKATAFVAKFFRWVIMKVSSTESNIKRLQALLKDRKWDSEKAADAKGEVIDPKKYDDASVSKVTNDLNSVKNDMAFYTDVLTRIASGAEHSTTTGNKSLYDDRADNDTGLNKNAAEKQRKERKELIDKLKKVADSKININSGSVNSSYASQMLDKAITIVTAKIQFKACQNVLDNVLKQASNVTKKLEAMNSGDNESGNTKVKTLRKTVNYITKDNTHYTKCISTLMVVANAIVQSVAKVINACYVKA